MKVLFTHRTIGLVLSLLLSCDKQTSAFTGMQPPSAVLETVQQVQHQLQHQYPLSPPASTQYIVTWLLAPSTNVEQQQQLSPLQVASPSEVERALRNPKTVLLDARTDEEILQGGWISIRGHQWVHASGTPDANPLLELTAEKQLPDKNAPVVVYCGTGKRAAKAKDILDGKGYKLVLNAGAFKDLDYLKGRG